MMSIMKVDRSSDYYENATIFKEKTKGILGHICPYCNTMNVLNIETDINITISARSNISINHARIDITCFECGKTWTTYDEGIDTNMIDIIMDLNNAGYKTMFCCEGHFDDPSTSIPYITFADHSITKHRPPRGWKFDSSLADGKVNLDWNRDFNNNNDKEKALKSLYKWVDKICKKRGN